MFPGAGQGFLAGLRGALEDAGLAHEIVPEPVGVCGDKDLAAERIQRLLLQRAPDVVTGIMGAGVLRHVHAHFSDAETPFIVNDLGGDPLMTGGAPNPFVFGNALHLWQSMYALGYWASQHIGRRACVAAALHEAGYGIVHAFWLGFSEAGGGEVLATEVTHRATPDDDPSEQIRRLAAGGPDFVMAFYAGREGVSFANAWSALGLAGTIPLLASPLMTHDFWRPRMPPEVIDGVRTAFSWDVTARPEAHERFRRVCGVAPGKEPAVFTLLGYETGQMLAAAQQAAGGALTGGAAWREALPGVAFSSPRGALHVDTESGEVDAEPYLFEWRRSADGTLGLVSRGPLERPASCRAAYAAIQASDARSGWFNPYLVT
jgi:branched-chain amino acid transport system substrate-binding protein